MAHALPTTLEKIATGSGKDELFKVLLFVFVEFFHYVWFDFNGANVLGLHFVNDLQSAKQLGGKWPKDLGEVISFGLDGA
jgi:hypothetical protein